MDNPASPQRTPTPTGTVHWGFAMSLDGFVAGPGHSMEFLNGATVEEGFIDQAIASIGAVLAGRDGYDSAIGDQERALIACVFRCEQQLHWEVQVKVVLRSLGLVLDSGQQVGGVHELVGAFKYHGLSHRSR